MNSIGVRLRREAAGWDCQVEIVQDGRRTEHRVHVSPAQLGRWGRGEAEIDVEDLVRRSFEFLLEREPASSILASFDLSVIQRYFPEYDKAIRR